MFSQILGSCILVHTRLSICAIMRANNRRTKDTLLQNFCNLLLTDISPYGTEIELQIFFSAAFGPRCLGWHQVDQVRAHTLHIGLTGSVAHTSHSWCRRGMAHAQFTRLAGVSRPTHRSPWLDCPSSLPFNPTANHPCEGTLYTPFYNILLSTHSRFQIYYKRNHVHLVL